MTSDVIVVDANVWLDYLFGGRPGNGAAVRFLTEAARLDASLVIPPHCMATVFFIFQQELKAKNREDGKLSEKAAAATARASAWAAVDFIMGLAAVGPSDHADAQIAAKHRVLHGDYEDNLVMACAMRTNARLLVTNDKQLIEHSPVPTMNAEDSANMLALE